MQHRLLRWISGCKSLRRVCFQFNRSKEYQSTSTEELSLRYVHWKRSFRVSVNCELWTRSFSYWVSEENKLQLERGNYWLQEKPIALWAVTSSTFLRATDSRSSHVPGNCHPQDNMTKLLRICRSKCFPMPKTPWSCKRIAIIDRHLSTLSG